MKWPEGYSSSRRTFLIAVVVAVAAAIAALVLSNLGDHADLWKIPGMSVAQANAATFPSDVDGYLRWDYVLMAAIAFGLIMGTFVGICGPHPLERTGKVQASLALTFTLAYLISDFVEDQLLHDLAQTSPPYDSEDIRHLAWASNAKWLCLAAAFLLMISLWNFGRPRRPGGVKDEQGQPLDWHRPDDEPFSLPHDHWAPDDHRFGISVSGGGVRSASFALGVFEVLREKDLLEHARYVTSVSGGSYATAALERANRLEERPPDFRRRLRGRINYLIPDAKTGLAAVIRLLLGLAISLWLIYLVIFAVFRPVGWLIGTPLVQESLRLDEPYVTDVFGEKDDPDQGEPTHPCGLATNPEAAPRLGDVTRTGGQDEFTVDVNDQCVQVRMPDGRKVTVTFQVETKDPGVLAFDRESGDAEVVQQPTFAIVCPDLDKSCPPVADDDPAPADEDEARPEPPRHPAAAEDQEGDGDEQVPVPNHLNELIELSLPDVELADRAEAAGPLVPSETLFDDLEPLDVSATSVVDAREDLDVDLRHWLPVLIGLVFSIAFWCLGGLPGTRRRLDRPSRRWLYWVPTIVALATLGYALVMLVFPALVDAIPSWLEPQALPSKLEDNAAWGWLPSRLPRLIALPILALTTIQGFTKKKEPTTATKPGKRNGRALMAKLKGRILPILSSLILVAAALASALTIMTTGALNGPFGDHAWISHEFVGIDFSWPSDLVLWSTIVLFLLLVGFAFPAGSWSLGTFYRGRLKWAFTRGDRDGRLNGSTAPGAQKKVSNKEKERAGFLDGKKGNGAELVICCTANVQGNDRAPAGRRAVSFTASRSWIGGPEIDWVPTNTYLDKLGKNREKDVTITSLTALSGAAVSSAMGKGSLTPMGSVLAVLNVRLGGWLPHPGAIRSMGELPEWKHTPGWTYFLREVLRHHRHESHYLYITDGGHWENLGLVEALRRGCNTIVAISAAGDGGFSHSTFAEAVEIARTDLGVEIAIDDIWRMRPKGGGDADEELPSGRQFLLQGGDDPEVGRAAPFGFSYGRFTRSPHPDDDHEKWEGHLLLIEATMVDELPVDVHAYAEKHDEFPDISTGDQFFDNADFDAYRMLGRVLMAKALKHDTAVKNRDTQPPKARGEEFRERVEGCVRTP